MGPKKTAPAYGAAAGALAPKKGAKGPTKGPPKGKKKVAPVEESAEAAVRDDQRAAHARSFHRQFRRH